MEIAFYTCNIRIIDVKFDMYDKLYRMQMLSLIKIILH